MLARRHFLTTGSAGLIHLGLSQARTAAAVSLSPYAKRVLEKKPCGYWRLGEKAGPVVADASGHGHEGRCQGEVRLGEKGVLDRDLDTALVFDGKTAWVEIPDAAAFSQPASGAGLTVEAWMRPDTLDFAGEGEDGYIHWLGKGEAGRQEWAFRFYPKKSSRPSRISAYIFNPGPGLGAGAYVEEDIRSGRWMHIVATFDPGDKNDPKAGVSIYKDGKLAGGPATSPGALYKSYDIVPQRGDAPLRLGTRDAKSFFTGALDEVAIYPRVLSPREVADNYRAGKAG